MFRSTLFLAFAASLAAGSALADEFQSPPAAESLAKARQAQLAAARGGVSTAAAPTVEEVGDADSFGRGVKWLGLMSGFAFLSTDCTPPPGEPADPNCVQLNPAPGFTTFVVPDVAAITLPGKSAESLLCHSQTPVTSVVYANNTGARQQYRFQLLASYRIESEVLQGLNDPNTGDPYNGAIEIGIGNLVDSGYLEPGDNFVKQYTQTRACIGGMVSRRALVDAYGLTAAQARQFFRKPITLRMTIRGNARMVDAASINVGTRVTGD
ncbi:MAG: hypothetical protein ABS41_04880 [Arenimonas sp. SCN 70-307]|uniref:hypothetical protein n=1 Tax=Arenimonas sp. SCN 70-307 TaxID=1660089 RepID=UPI000868BADA|nr:hypothetical protein [Arenimonas sp. SCN 70-307]ODS63661.1 MAG: hypothetical protein ABS41_04880 [Arenimonas sp. SCN 70-307]